LYAGLALGFSISDYIGDGLRYPAVGLGYFYQPCYRVVGLPSSPHVLVVGRGHLADSYAHGCDFCKPVDCDLQ
jgi:hypothetical protein